MVNLDILVAKLIFLLEIAALVELLTSLGKEM